jgi:hypothetical protein
MKIFSLLLLFCLSFSTQAATTPKPFVTDLCTGYPEGTLEQPKLWAHCCLKHDLDLWAGGKESHRTQVDLNLRECVSLTGQPQHARLMWLGVRLGRLSPIKIPGQQWGNAWGSDVRDELLSKNEIMLLQATLRDSTLGPDAIEHFIQDLIRRNLQ